MQIPSCINLRYDNLMVNVFVLLLLVEVFGVEGFSWFGLYLLSPSSRCIFLFLFGKHVASFVRVKLGRDCVLLLCLWEQFVL